MKLRVGRRTVEISHPDKVLFPDAGITKEDLARYHHRIADRLLPHLRGRPLTLHRFPDGIDTDGFYQKNAPDHFPDWLRVEEVATASGEESVRHVVVSRAADLVYLADQGTIALHRWLSRLGSLDRPDLLVFDLDPPEGSDDFGEVVAAARALRGTLEDLEFTPYVMTTGSSGLHVVVPLRAEDSFDEVRDFAKRVAGLTVRREPDRFTTAARKEDREGRLYLDVMRNARGQTAVTPYGVRAKPGAPVAVPVRWDELGGDLGPRTWTVSNLFRRLGNVRDPWLGMGRRARSLGPALDRLSALESDAGKEESAS